MSFRNRISDTQETFERSLIHHKIIIVIVEADRGMPKITKIKFDLRIDNQILHSYYISSIVTFQIVNIESEPTLKFINSRHFTTQ